jgi:hypothetical protein
VESVQANAVPSTHVALVVAIGKLTDQWLNFGLSDGEKTSPHTTQAAVNNLLRW